MSPLFPYGSSTEDSWFRVGRLEVTTVVFVVLASAIGMLAWVFAPSIGSLLALTPSAILEGQVWRLVTWPLADGLSIWSVLNLFFLWYFGTMLERQIGRRPMASLFVGMWASLTLVTVLLGLAMPTGVGLAGLQLVEFMVLLLWVAEYPNQRFIFNIPAWALGAVLLALQVFSLVAARMWTPLLAFVISLVLVAVVARRVGLLGEYAWIPGRPRARKPKPVKQPRKVVKEQQRRASDSQRMDELLDKINAQGIHSLTDRERKELEEIRKRRRG